MALDIVLLTVMVVAGLWAVMARSLLKSAIGLAIVSIIVTIIMFRLNAPLAGVFELSVCTGLITVIFIGAVSLTKPMTREEAVVLTRSKIKRYLYLPVITMIIGAAGFMMMKLSPSAPTIAKAIGETDVRNLLWNFRQIDLFGEICLLIAGSFGVVILFKEMTKK